MSDNNNIFEGVKDDSLPLEELLKKSEEKKSDDKKEEVTKEEKPLSPLEQLKREKEKKVTGMVVSNKELEEGMNKAPSADMVHTDERQEEWQKAIDEQDEILKQRNAVTLVHQPKDQGEYIKMMDEIASVKFDENGNAHFEYIDYNGEYTDPYFVRIKKEGDLDFDVAELNKVNPYGIEGLNKNNEENTDGTEETSTEPSKKDKIVQVLIDKTGFGADFAFTDEEKKKIQEADVIRINEVKTIDIASLKEKRSKKSFQDVIKEYNVKGSKSTICFPASGFRASMKGLTYGEYADVSLSMDNVTFDQYMKRLSIIYNKMTNISTGAFKDFEDFLHHFAYTDIYLAVYAMFVATEQENQSILLKCGNAECNRTFDWSYQTRSLLRLEDCAETFLDKMQEIATADAMDYDKIRDNAAVNTSHTIVLPDSGFIVDMGVASAYDFVYNFIPLLNEDTFKDAFGDDLNEIYMNNIILLTSVRAVHIPDGEGGYVECTGYKDILDAIYNVTPREIQILSAYTVKIQNQYEVSFAFKNVVCPHCGRKTESIAVSVDELVFQTYQQLMNTSVDLENMPSF